MHDMMKIMERELDNTGLIYIYRESGRWYAYEQSAFFVCQMLRGQVDLGKVIMNNTLWLTRAEVEIELVPHEYLVSYCADEYVFYYVPDKKFQDYLAGVDPITGN